MENDRVKERHTTWKETKEKERKMRERQQMRREGGRKGGRKRIQSCSSGETCIKEHLLTKWGLLPPATAPGDQRNTPALKA